jgi:DNA repair exonuclease SbcCD ATPase subunit
MKYTRIVLNGYRRMQLHGFDHFEMKLELPLQLILGKNGSGKSSLMWELSPLPANSADYAPNGGKTIELEHKGHRYVLTSTFGAKQEHSFVYDDEELNKGHTITVQKELVKDHFRITHDIQELLSGQEKFVEMSAARRKDWFLRLCDVNYDYALSIYGKLKNAHRDRTGAIRLERKALVVEAEKLLSEQEILQISEETQWLHECLSHLLEYRKPVETDLHTLDVESGQLDRQLVSLANNFTEIHQRINDRENSDAELMDLIGETNNVVVSAQTKIGMLAELHEQVAQKVSVLQKAGENTISGLEEQIAQANAELAAASASTILAEPLAQPERALLSFDAIRAQLLEIFSTIPNNADKKYSQPALLKAREELDAKRKLLSNKQEWLAEKRASLSHMRDHLGKPDALCPKCNHAFSLFYSEEGMLTLTRGVVEIEDYLATDVVPGIVETEAYIEECGRYGSLFRQFAQLTTNSASLQGYWAWLLDKRVLTDTPDQGVILLGRIENDLRHQVSQWQLREKIAGLTTNLEMLRSVGDADLSELQTQAAQLEEQLAEQTQTLQVAQSQNAHYKSQFALRAQAATIRRSMRKAIHAQRHLMKDKVEHQRRTILNQLIRDLQSALATREHALFAARRQKETVDAMSRKIDQLVKDEKALGILVKELSPTEGLIAEGMLGFIKNYCAAMNALIEEVWAYPFAVQSCEEIVEGDSIDLDYRFPMLVGERQFPVADVSKGSDGMKEIVNLAFRITAMQYLNMEDSPLYLDEPGRAFDKEHRTTATNMIRSLIEQKSFPQVFMISHYEGMYGALANPQVCVLDVTDTLVPQAYNQHVTMS